MPSLTPAELRLAHEMGRAREQGASIRALSRMFHRHRTTVSHLLKITGYLQPPNQNPYDGIKAARRKQAAALYQTGASIKAVARFLGCSDFAARTLLIDLDILRDSGRQKEVAPMFTWRESALCRAVTGNGISLEGARDLYVPELGLECAQSLVERYRELTM